jgi:Protein of unknown function (DUF2656)
VDELNLGRMLLSHNFQVTPDVVPSLSREEFTAVFVQGLGESIHCHSLDNPHWIVEILFPMAQFTPQEIGDLCAQALAKKRLAPSSSLDILVLGGLKTTPPTTNSPSALQPGNWGVDVVETSSGKDFLVSIDWDRMIADKPATSIFIVELKVG